MSKVLIIGCGGVASVAITSAARSPRCSPRSASPAAPRQSATSWPPSWPPKTTTKITTAQVDADKVDEVIALIKLISPTS